LIRSWESATSIAVLPLVSSSTLEAVKAAVIAGELDAQIQAARGALRSGFKNRGVECERLVAGRSVFSRVTVQQRDG
jgi:hypothetical protein